MLKALVFSILVSPLAAWAGSQTYDVKIDGMTCDSCAKQITSALSKLPNVDAKSVKVVVSEKKAVLTVSEDKKEMSEQIKKAIEGAGFKVTAVNTMAAKKAN